MKNPNQFLDVRAIVDSALSAGGGLLTLTSKSAAITWVWRFNQFRKAIQAQDAASRSVQFGRSAYDAVSVRRLCGCANGKCREPDACTGHVVRIADTPQITGELTTLAGAKLDIGEAKAVNIPQSPFAAARRMISEDDE